MFSFSQKKEKKSFALALAFQRGYFFPNLIMLWLCHPENKHNRLRFTNYKKPLPQKNKKTKDLDIYTYRFMLLPKIYPKKQTFRDH